VGKKREIDCDCDYNGRDRRCTASVSRSKVARSRFYTAEVQRFSARPRRYVELSRIHNIAGDAIHRSVPGRQYGRSTRVDRLINGPDRAVDSTSNNSAHPIRTSTTGHYSNIFVKKKTSDQIHNL